MALLLAAVQGLLAEQRESSSGPFQEDVVTTLRFALGDFRRASAPG